MTPNPRLVSSAGDNSIQTTVPAALWAFACLILAVAVFFHPFIFGGKVISSNDLAYTTPPFDLLVDTNVFAPHNPLLADQVQQFHAYRSYQLENVRKGVWPRWLPHILCGNSFTGNTQAQAWYPWTYLGLMLPIPVAESVTKVIETLLAGLGMLLLLRRLSGISYTSALLGALAFSFCSYRIVWLNHPHSSSITYLPWLLWAVAGIFYRQRSLYLSMAICAVLVFLTIAGGHPQTFILVLLGTGLFGAGCMIQSWTSRCHPPRTIAISSSRWMAAMFIGILAASVILLPFADSLFNDSFTYGDRAGAAKSGILPARAFLTMIHPLWFGSPVTGNDTNLYNYNENAMFVGIVTIWFLVLGLPWAMYRRGYCFFMLLSLVIIAVLCGMPVLSPLVRALPVIRDMPIMRATLLLQFSMAVCGSLGLASVIEQTGENLSNRVIGWLIFSSGCLTALMLATGLAADHVSQVRFALIPLGLIIAVTMYVLVKRRWAPGLTWISIVVLYIELHAAHAQYNPAIPLAMAALPEPSMVTQINTNKNTDWFRVTAIDGTLTPNLGLLFGVNDTRGYDLPMKRRYVDFLRHAFYGGSWNYGMIYWHAGGADFLKPANTRLIELMGIRYVFYEGKAHRISALTSPTPYCYIASNVTSSIGDIHGDVEILRTNHGHVAEIEADMIPSNTMTGTAILVRKDVNGATINAELSSPGIVVINEMPINGWKAMINGANANIFPVNIIHTGVIIPAGKSTIVFSFYPDSFALGLWMSGAAILGIVTLLGLHLRQRRGADQSAKSRRVIPL